MATGRMKFNEYEHSNGESTWKGYDRFTLRVLYHGRPRIRESTAPYTTPIHNAATLLLNNFQFYLLSISTCRAQLASPCHIVCCSFLRAHGHHGTAASPSCVDPSRRTGGHPYSGPRREHSEGEGVPLVVLLEPLVLPASVLLIVETLLDVLLMAAISYSVLLSCVLGTASLGSLPKGRRRSRWIEDQVGRRRGVGQVHTANRADSGGWFGRVFGAV
jgi:hypothetical protein